MELDERLRIEKDADEYLKKFVDSLQFFGKAFTCPICLSFFKDAYTTCCLHTFCENCLKKCISAKPECPLCKTKCTRRQIGPYEKMARLVNIFRDLHPKNAGTDEDPDDFDQLTQCAPGSQLLRSFGGSTSAYGEVESDRVIDHHEEGAEEETDNVVKLIKAKEGKSDVQIPIETRGFEELKSSEERVESPRNEKASPKTIQNMIASRKENRIEDISPEHEESGHKNETNTTGQSETHKENECRNARRSLDDELPFAEVNPKTAFVVGNTVTVAPQTGPGMNKPGGAGRIERVNPDGTYFVRFTIGRHVDKRVPAHLIHPGSSLVDGKRRSTRTRKSEQFEKERERRCRSTAPRKRKSDEIRPKTSASKRHRDRAISLSGTQEREVADALWDMAVQKATLRGESSTNPRKSPRIVLSGFKPSTCEKLATLIRKLGGAVVDGILGTDDQERGASHIVALSTKVGRNMLIKKRTIKVMKGMLQGLWIVDKKWVLASSSKKRWLDELVFELHGDAGLASAGIGGPRRARELVSARRLVLHNTKVALWGEFKSPPREDLIQLLGMAGAILITTEQAISAHQCEHKDEIIVIAGIHEEAARGDPNLKQLLEQSSLSIVEPKWLFDSVSLYSKQPTTPYNILLPS